MLIKHIGVILFLMLTTATHAADSTTVQVLHLKVQANIDPRTNRYTELGLAHAQELDVDFVILELDTYGGALNDADEIRTRILNFDRPIYAFINKDAASAGALISIACDSIYMAKGSSIGAATVVTQDGAAAPDKYQSYMRSIMRSTAEAKGRNPKIAEGMVDEDIDLDSIATEGKVVTFSVSEAIQYGFCEAQVNSIDEIMTRSGVTSYEIEEYKLDLTERIIALFLNPFVSGILILIIIGGIYFELQTPGVGFPILASAIAVILYFTPYYLNGLAENWEIIAFVGGVLLIAAEVFIIPGFGIAGIAGLILTLGSLVLVMLNNDALDFSFVNMDDIFIAVATTLAGLFGAIIVMFFGGVRLANSKVFQNIALQDVQDQSQGYTSSYYKSKSLVGKKGTAYTILRPSGRVEIEGELYDAYTRGNYIESGTTVEVISDEGTSLKVRELK
ncbi:NfeD family protein [Marinoscillum furvescens]|uniref:Membrane-bound serine protease (ClpP class) n=1 Tax=Marinoscillum furvescens DSM 4134 TaxID=1122208 RepID=A0A3D9L362_MARFU|nr:NfeD family protein [Marinoscillum furvescens]RED97498.1 membrane-bound serine protease (ClpP class) [Marinoscillum furvescens DSM 4134]